jgi:hypothetical protein
MIKNSRLMLERLTYSFNRRVECCINNNGDNFEPILWQCDFENRLFLLLLDNTVIVKVFFIGQQDSLPPLQPE